MPLNLTGQKVKLRALETRDLDAIWDAYQNLDLELTTSGDAPPISDVQVRDFWMAVITNPGPDLRYFAIEPLPGQPGAGSFAGACSLQHIDTRNRHAELGIWMAQREGRSQGFGTEAVNLLLDYAFEVVRLDKVHLGVYDFNEAGLRTYERVGFRYEGRLRQMLYYDGRLWDEWPMGMLRSEWQTIRQPPANGLRLYHPADQEPALELIRQHVLRGGDHGAARTLLRRWWRQIDRSVYGYQQQEKLCGILTVGHEDQPPTILDIAASEPFHTAIRQAVESLSTA